MYQSWPVIRLSARACVRLSVTFLVNVSPAIQLDVPTSKFVAVLHCSHDLEDRVTLAPNFFFL